MNEQLQEQLKARIEQVNEFQDKINNLQEENKTVKELQREIVLLKDNAQVRKFDIHLKEKAIENLKKQIVDEYKKLWTEFFIATISRPDRSYNEFVEFTNKTMAEYKSYWAKQEESQGDSNDESG